MPRSLSYAHALREALDQALAQDPCVYVMGLGVPDPKGIFETTLGLQAKHGRERVLDMPASENGMTGIAVGSALVGMRPVLVHQRLDFALLALDPMVNQAAKWHYAYGGRSCVPLVVRLIVGRGWGQGAQHAQSLHAWFAHVPGLKVILPATPHDAKGMLLAAIADNNPVLCIEHRWLFGIEGPVPETTYRVPLGVARVIRPGRDLTIAAVSHSTIDALRAAEILAAEGIDAEVLDLRTLRPLDRSAIVESVRKTGRLLAADIGWKAFGAAAEVMAVAVEGAFASLKAAPVRVGLADCPSPSTPALAKHFFPRVGDIVNAARRQLGRPEAPLPEAPDDPPADVPDHRFRGPF